ncbi:MAG TPA: cupredoxin domain-containing protein [Anaeromyxobacter sp.]|nr:cupredoxin domain-containing protein [Anaeromyxobacter sp.]
MRKWTLTFLTAAGLAAAALILPSQGNAAGAAPKVVQMSISDDGVSPMAIPAKQGEPLRIAITRTTDATCITHVVVKDYGINVPIPKNKTVNVDITPKATGKVRVACGMGMNFAVLNVQ